VERKTFDVAAEPDQFHDDREQVRHDDEQAHGEQKRHDEGKDKLPVLEFLSGPFRAALGGKVQCLDAVDEGFYQRGETAQERFFEQLAAGEAEPRAVFDADVAVGRADGQRIDVAVAHHDAFHHGLPRRRAARGLGTAKGAQGSLGIVSRNGRKKRTWRPDDRCAWTWKDLGMSLPERVSPARFPTG